MKRSVFLGARISSGPRELNGVYLGEKYSIVRIFCFLAVSGVAVFGIVPSAPMAADRIAHPADPKATAAVAPLSDGEVRKVDKGAGKVTIKHGPLPNLDMPAMTMVFRIKDPAVLEQLKEGDKIKFGADRVNGTLTVTEVEVVR